MNSSTSLLLIFALVGSVERRQIWCFCRGRERLKAKLLERDWECADAEGQTAQHLTRGNNMHTIEDHKLRILNEAGSVLASTEPKRSWNVGAPLLCRVFLTSPLDIIASSLNFSSKPPPNKKKWVLAGAARSCPRAHPLLYFKQESNWNIC